MKKEQIIAMLQVVSCSIDGYTEGFKYDPIKERMIEPTTTTLSGICPSSLDFVIDETIKFIKENVK